MAVSLERTVRSSANWCYWIAALTAINAVAAAFHSEFGFALGSMVGLGAMQWAVDKPTITQLVAAGFNLVVIGYFVLIGVFARKEERWAFAFAFGAYFLDSLLLIAAPDIISVALHVWGLVALGNGFFKVKLLQEEREAAALEPPPLRPAGRAAAGELSRADGLWR